MTAACNGGVSAPKLGAQLTIGIGSAKIAQLLSLAEGAFWTEVIPLLVVPEILLSNFCASDPPAYPTFTQPEADDLLNLNFTSNFFSGLPKLVQLVQRLVWFDQCYCQTGTLVSNTPVPVAPNGTHVIQQPVPQPGASCGFSQLGPGQLDQNNATYTWRSPPFPTGVTLMTHHVQLSRINVNTVTTDLHFEFFQNGSTINPVTTTPIHFDGINNIDFTYTYEVPVGTTQMMYVFIGGGNPGVYFENIVSLAYCGTTPGVQQPCCPPDATTQATLNAILKIATLIQRQGDPFGYVSGTVHTGLSGNGAIALQGLLGVKVLPSAIPPPAGLEVGDPDSLWLDSWIRWGNADGWTQREFLTASPFVSLPALAGQYTRLGYTLGLGLLVDVTELVREP